jgi:hypothetical protein
MISNAPPGVDMSPMAIDRRIRTLSGLYQLVTAFKTVKLPGKSEHVPEPPESLRKLRQHGPGSASPQTADETRD